MKRHQFQIILSSILLICLVCVFSSCKDDANEPTPAPVNNDTGTPCPGMETITITEQVYHTILIGEQCWLRENLNIGTMLHTQDTLKNNDTIEKYCYENDPANCEKYGGLYTWHEMMKYMDDTVNQGICPEGWHVPSDTDWSILEGSLDSLYAIGDTIWDTTGWRGYDAGAKMRHAGLEEWFDPNTGATNSSGFTALPAGIRYYDDKTFDKIKGTSYMWSSSRSAEPYGWYRLLSYTRKDVRRNTTETMNAFSVRCVMN